MSEMRDRHVQAGRVMFLRAEINRFEKELIETRESLAITQREFVTAKVERVEAIKQRDTLAEALEEIEIETRPEGSMADLPVNQLTQAALAAVKGGADE